MAEAEHGFKEGDTVWVEDGDGKHHPGVFVGDNESSGWFGGGPSAYVVHPEAHNAEVVSIFRITPRDEYLSLASGPTSPCDFRFVFEDAAVAARRAWSPSQISIVARNSPLPLASTLPFAVGHSGTRKLFDAAAGDEGDPHPEAATRRGIDVAAVVAEGPDRGAAGLAGRARPGRADNRLEARAGAAEARGARASPSLAVDEGQGLRQHLQQLLLRPLPRCPEAALQGPGAFALLAAAPPSRGRISEPPAGGRAGDRSPSVSAGPCRGACRSSSCRR